MKKRFILLLLAAALIVSFIPASAGTEAVTVSGTIYLDDSITVPEGGLPVTVYIGSRRNHAAALPYGEWEKERNGIGYKGTEISVPTTSGIRGRISRNVSIREEKTFVIPYGCNSIDYAIETTKVSEGSRFIIGYGIDTDGCAGYDFDFTESLENDIYVESIQKKVSVSGQIGRFSKARSAWMKRSMLVSSSAASTSSRM